MANAAMMPAEGSRLHSLTEQDVRDVLRHHNPGVAPSRVQAMAAILAVAADVLAELPDARRRELARAKGKFREALVRAAAENTDIGEDRLRLDSAGPVEWRRGSGLGKRISLEEGQAQLDRYAEAMPLESWAGPVAGAGEIERHLGIPRSTLSHWQQRGVIVGLLRGERKLAYPLEQFVDARPIEGIADVIGIAPDARSAWLWLRQSHAALDGQAPLAALRRVGGRDEVVQAAKRDFV